MRAARALWLSLLLAPACGGGASSASGVTAYLRATGTGAQFVPGELDTTPGMMEPTVDNVTSNNTHVFPGAVGRAITGSVNGKATAVAFGLEGDSGHWLVPVGVPDFTMLGNFTFATSLSFSPELPFGTRSLNFRGVDALGNLGPVQSLALKVDAPAPTGTLVIQLTWDTEADLDLHVRIPNPDTTAKLPYYDVWNRAPSALPPLPSDQDPYTPDQIAAGGALQFDSNANCVIDGQRHEEVVWPAALPAGPYEVRVDTFSLCGEAIAHWNVRAFTNPGKGAPMTTLVEANGVSLDRDTFAPHNGGSGVLAFTLNPPQ